MLFVMEYRIVIDTSVVVSALLSQRGASYRLLMLADSGRFTTHVSVPLVAEYEDVVNRILPQTKLKQQNANDILDYLCLVAEQQRIFYLWRPFLRDPKDDMVLELAVAARCELIVTFNSKDFAGTDKFGITVVTPKQFLHLIGELP